MNNKKEELTEELPAAELTPAKSKTLHYIGPTIIKFDLVRGRTYKKLPANIEQLIKNHPALKHVMVSTNELAAATQRVNEVGSFENKIFNELKGL